MTNKPMLSVERELLEELQWHYRDRDDYYHKPSGYYCPMCGSEKTKEHESTCELRAILGAPAVETDVRKVLLAVVPGADGEGEEVYAETVADVEVLLSTQAERIEDLEAELANLLAGQHRSKPVPFAWFRFDDDQKAIFTRSKRTEDSEALYVHPTAYRVPRAEPPTGPFGDDTVVCRRYTLEQSPGQNFYHYDIEPAYGSVPVTISELITMAESAPVAAVMPEHTMRSVMEITQEASQFYVPGTSNWCGHIANKLNGIVADGKARDV